MGQEEAIKAVQKCLAKLRKLKNYDKKEALSELKSIDDCYWDFDAFRKEMGEALVQGNAAELFLKILQDLGKLGYFKNDSVWHPVYYVFNVSLNFSDASLPFAKSLGASGMIKLCADILDNSSYKEKLEKIKNVKDLCQACLGILHNMSKAETLKSYFHQDRVFDKIKPYLDCSAYIKAETMMVIAGIVEESEVALLKSTGTIEYIIDMCEKAMNTKGRRCEGFSVKELVQGLERLAVYNQNCRTIIEANGLATLKNVLAFHDCEEEVNAVKAIWSLAFDEIYSRPILIKDKTIMRTLETLAHSPNKEVSESAAGALWVLKGSEEKEEAKPTETNKDEKHVMISYQWDAQDLVLKIKDALKARGFKVWIDVERMSGSILGAMAEAVQDARTVVLCITEKYFRSQNCRTEAQYAYERKKKIVPLMLENRFHPDGWLGALIATRLYVEFRGQYDFEKQIPKLAVEIGTTEDESGVKTVVVSASEVCKPKVAQAMPEEQIPAMNWSNLDVKNWLYEIGLDKYSSSFKDDFDGTTLCKLKNLRREAPEFFYNALRNDFGFVNFVDLFKFRDAVDAL